MYKKLGVLLALSVGFLGSSAASAQVAGDYEGTSLDGQNISITVSFDSGTGFYEITSAQVWYNAICVGQGAGLSVNEGLGWGPNTELPPGKNTMAYAGNEQNVSAILSYHTSTNSFSGSIDTLVGALIPNGAARPNRVMKCESVWQPLSLHYVGPARTRSPAKGTVVHLQPQN